MHRTSSLILAVFIVSFLTGYPYAGWASFAKSDLGLNSAAFNDLAIEGQTLLWGATQGSGVVDYDGQSWENILALWGDLPSDNVKVICVCTDALGNVWMGTELGLAVFAPDSNWVRYTETDGLARNSVTALAIDGTGRKWIGTEDGGISVFTGTTWNTLTVDSGLVDSSITVIAKDQTGMLWIGTPSGVSTYAAGVWDTFTVDNGLADNEVNDIFVDKNNNIWFATTNGVSRYARSSGTWDTINNPDTGIGTNIFYKIRQDRYGFLWFASHEGGVKKFDPARFTFVTTYFIADGLINNVVTAVAVDSNNVRWFGTEDGISRFVNDPPVITSTKVRDTAYQDQEYTRQCAAADTNRDRVAFSMLNPPIAMTITAATGSISWTPSRSDGDSVTYAVIADDGNGGLDTQTITVVISHPTGAAISPAATLITAAVAYLASSQVIAYAVPGAGDSRSKAVLRLYDSRGSLIRNFTKDKMTPGYHRVSLAGAITSGLYVIRLQTENQTINRTIAVR